MAMTHMGERVGTCMTQSKKLWVVIPMSFILGFIISARIKLFTLIIKPVKVSMICAGMMVGTCVHANVSSGKSIIDNRT